MSRKKNRKYKCTDERIVVDGHVLYRIKALKSFGDINKGTLGGFIESHSNLSHKGECWVGYEAKVYGDSGVNENAYVGGTATVIDSIITSNAFVANKVTVNSYIGQGAYIAGDAIVTKSNIRYATIVDYAQLSNVHFAAPVNVKGNSIITSLEDYVIIKNWWSSGRYILWTKSNNMWSVGCFYGTAEQLLRRATGEQYEGYKQIIDFVETKVLKKKKSWRSLILSFMTQIKENL